MPETRELSLTRAVRNAGGTPIPGRVPIFNGTGNDITQSSAAPVLENSTVLTALQDAISNLENNLDNNLTSPEATVKGRITGVGEGTTQDLSPSQIRTLINVNEGATVGANWGTNLTNIPNLVSSFGALTPTNGQFVYFTSSSTLALINSSADGRSILSAADYSTIRSLLGLTIGSTVQAYNPNLAAFSGVSITGDTLVFGNGTSTLSTTPLTSFARTLLDDVDVNQAKITLEIPDRIITLADLDVDDNPILPSDEELAGPLMYVPGAEPTARPVPTVPMVPATASQYWQGSSGLIYAEPNGLAQSKQIVNLGNRSGTFTLDGSNGFSQRLTATDDIIVSSMAGCIDGQEYTVRIIAGSGGPHTITFGGNTQPPSDLPGEITPGVTQLDTGDTLIFKMVTYLDEAEVTRFVEVYGAELREPPPLFAPTITSGSISPISSSTTVPFTVSTNVVGNPNPTLTYQGFVNGFSVPGATANPWTPPANGLIQVTVTATNTQGVDSETYTARVGRAQPIVLGQEFKLKTTSGNGTESFALTGGHFSSVPVAGDEMIYIENIVSNSTTAPSPPATGFTRVGNPINAISGDADFYRIIIWRKTLTSDDILAGSVSGLRIGGLSSAEAIFVRGLGQIDYDSTATISASALSSTVAMRQSTSSHPAIALQVIFSFSHDTKTAVGTLSDATWTAHSTATFGNTSTSRHGHRTFRRRVSSGTNPGGTFTGASPDNSRLSSIVIFLIGPDG